MGDCGIGNFRLLNGLAIAIEACPALFPGKNALPATQPLGRGSRHLLASLIGGREFGYFLHDLVRHIHKFVTEVQVVVHVFETCLET